MDAPYPIRQRSTSGFPSPADDYSERRLDLNDLLIPHPLTTFFAHVDGHSMQGAGLVEGDILVVDRALEPVHNDIVIALLDGQLRVRCMQLTEGTISFHAASPAYPPIEVSPEQLHIWGVVTFVIHPLHPPPWSGSSHKGPNTRQVKPHDTREGNAS